MLVPAHAKRDRQQGSTCLVKIDMFFIASPRVSSFLVPALASPDRQKSIASWIEFDQLRVSAPSECLQMQAEATEDTKLGQNQSSVSERLGNLQTFAHVIPDSHQDIKQH